MKLLQMQEANRHEAEYAIAIIYEIKFNARSDCYFALPQLQKRVRELIVELKIGNIPVRAKLGFFIGNLAKRNKRGFVYIN